MGVLPSRCPFTLFSKLRRGAAQSGFSGWLSPRPPVSGVLAADARSEMGSRPRPGRADGCHGYSFHGPSRERHSSAAN